MQINECFRQQYINAAWDLVIQMEKTLEKLLKEYDDIYIREYLDAEEYIEIFQKINSKEATEEYSAHTDDFV